MSPKLFAMIVRIILVCLLFAAINSKNEFDWGWVKTFNLGWLILAIVFVPPIAMFALVRKSNSWVIGQVIGTSLILAPIVLITASFNYAYHASLSATSFQFIVLLLFIVSIFQWIKTRKVINHGIVVLGIYLSVIYYFMLFSPFTDDLMNI